MTFILLLDFLKKADHYDNLSCYALGITKAVVGTTENMADPDYDVIKMVAILNYNENLPCIIIPLILGKFSNRRFQKVQSTLYSLLKKMAEPNNDNQHEFE